MFKNFLQIISTKNLLSVFFFFYLSPIYANDFLLNFKCIVSTVGLQDNLEWSETILNKVGLEFEVDIFNKKLLMKQIFPFPNETKILETDYKIISVKKNSLIAVSEEFIDKNTGFPDVTTITLKKSSSDNFLFESNTPVGFTLTNNQQSSWEQYYFAIQHGECK